jgi:hypothetical protein
MGKTQRMFGLLGAVGCLKNVELQFVSIKVATLCMVGLLYYICQIVLLKLN